LFHSKARCQTWVTEKDKWKEARGTVHAAVRLGEKNRSGPWPDDGTLAERDGIIRT